MTYIVLTSEQIEAWKPKILCKLRAEGARDLKDSTLRRILLPTVGGQRCVDVARFLRDYGYICVGREE